MASVGVSLRMRYHAPRRSGDFTSAVRRAHWNAVGIRALAPKTTVRSYVGGVPVNRSVAGARAPVAERLPRQGHELPTVVVGVQGELEDAERIRDHFAVGMDR